MSENNRIEDIQQEYHEFCLFLLGKIPENNTELERLSIQAHNIYCELKIAIAKKKTIRDYILEGRIENDRTDSE